MRRIPITGTFTLSAALLVALACEARWGEPESRLSTGSESGAGVRLDEAGAAPEVHLNLIDKKLALSLAVDNQGQIEMAEFALKSISNDSLRQFVAQRLEGDRAFAAELNALTDGQADSTLARAKREIEADRAPEQAQGKKFRLLSVRNATAMLARIRVEILQDYSAMQHAELAAKSADKFDLHYLRCDLLNQMQTLAMLRVFENQASADFAEVIHRACVRSQQQFETTNQLLLHLETAPLADVATTQAALVETVVKP